ncbi:hypothetical protein PHYSODRAFT_285667 [Phytophthora sojae]|uniref:Retrotransposon gag domain-containing protein n=1 Tax=Phytophthora sojae (strain P6497) TaxID=1094619 RepID=G4Z8F5_PHYSP|nr:hypothetical protein PHYSODRAFT_285667 [Phytophthora sojae]EGZ21875.1 hypothetical protein PHYSODRAFT_285667 [Phytophthora sojae]|eukprot:XP_009524592.1 hypothetical protein PHYSODRAFT_285667 [Phytophthora sojae]
MSQGATGPIASTYYGGMPSHVKNAVRIIQPFHSDHATVDKAKLFWDSFARATTGLEEQLRISAFRECLKGKPAEEWWMYSKIDSFETLRIRFHNQFICLSPLQLIERLKTTKRSHGMSAEVWGDLVKSLCDEAQCFDPTMKYQYFLSELRNREWKAALSSAMASTIQQAVLILLQRGMHIPVEDDADFADEKSSENKSEDSAVKEMMEMLRQNQSLIMQQQAELARAPRSQLRRGRVRDPTCRAASDAERSAYAAYCALLRGSVRDPTCTRKMGVPCVAAATCSDAAGSTVAGNDSPAGTASSKDMLPRSARPRLETKATMVVGKDSPVVKVAVEACVRTSGVVRPTTMRLTARRSSRSSKWRRRRKLPPPLRERSLLSNEGGMREERRVSLLPLARGPTPGGVPRVRLPC